MQILLNGSDDGQRVSLFWKWKFFLMDSSSFGQDKKKRNWSAIVSVVLLPA